MKSTYLVVCLNPTLQKTLRFASIRIGQVNRATRVRLDVAGKGGSVTRVLTQLGERAVHITQVGGAHLPTFLALCAADGLEIRPVEADIEIRHCITMLDDATRTMTELVEPGHPVGPALEERIMSAFADLLPDAHTVILTGSKAPGFSETVFPRMVEPAVAAGSRVLLDLRGPDLLGCLPLRPAIVKINVSEFSQTFCASHLPEEVETDSIPAELFDRMAQVRDAHGCDVVLTNGSRDVLFTESGAVARCSPHMVEAVNPIGCGDAVTAGIACGLHRGAPLREAIRFGLDCAARNVQLEKPGTIV